MSSEDGLVCPGLRGAAAGPTAGSLLGPSGWSAFGCPHMAQRLALIPLFSPSLRSSPPPCSPGQQCPAGTPPQIAQGHLSCSSFEDQTLETIQDAWACEELASPGRCPRPQGAGLGSHSPSIQCRGQPPGRQYVQ